MYKRQDTLTATNAGGIYEDYHIATRVEAEYFFNLAVPDSDEVSPYTLKTVFGSYSQDMFGDSYDASTSIAWYLSETGSEVGYVRALDGGIQIQPHYGSIFTSDKFSTGGEYEALASSWLLVGDANVDTVSTVSEPGGLALLSLGLAGLCFVRRKQNS